jgi:hypothetical protein
MSDESDLKDRARIIVTEYDGIFPAYLAFYVEAIFYAADRARSAFVRLSQFILSHAPASDIVATVHEALGHSAALSRFFFPAAVTPLARARAARLRRTFEVADNSPLQNRDLRNALEHFDERLDEYLLGDIAGYILPEPLVEDAGLADDGCGHIFRLVDPDAEIFVLLGRKHSFGAMRQEAERIAALAETMR